MPKPEGVHTTDMIKGIRNIGGQAEKIPDPTPMPGMPYMTVKRPFDVFGCYKGRMLVIEAKWLKEPEAFGKRHFSSHQLEKLQAYDRAGAMCFIMLFTKYERRIHMMVWRWSTFNQRSQAYGKKQLIELIKQGGSTVKRKGAFPATWLREAVKWYVPRH